MSDRQLGSEHFDSALTGAEYVVRIERFGALGLPEWDEDLRLDHPATVAAVMKHLATLCPLDRVTIEIGRCL